MRPAVRSTSRRGNREHDGHRLGEGEEDASHVGALLDERCRLRIAAVRFAARLRAMRACTLRLFREPT